MKINRVIVLSILVAVVFLVLIGLFVSKIFSPGPGNNEPNQTPTQTQQTPATTSSTQNPSTPTTPDPGPNADTHNALDDCITLKSTEAAGKNFVRGSLIVAFFAQLDYETAVDSMQLLGLRSDTSVEAQQNYRDHHWLTVNVPRNKEFEWQCKLEASEGVKSANLNLNFNLRQ